MNAPNILEAKVKRTFAAKPDKVFNAWLDPKLIGQWMFGPNIRDEVVVSIEVDARPGGAFSFLVQRDHLVVDHVGSYLKIEKPKHLSFTWGVKGMSDSSKVLVDIAAHDKGCELTLVHELHPDWKDYLQRSIDGWGQMLDALAKCV